MDDKHSITAAEQTEFLRMLVDEAASAVYVCDAETYQLYYVNRTCAQICHKTVDQAQGLTCYAYLKNADKPCEPCYLHTARRDAFTSREYTSQTTGRHYMARDKLIDWNGRPAMVEYLLDETERINSRLHLESSQRGLEMASVNGGVSFWRFDIDKRLLTWGDYRRSDYMGYPEEMPNMPEFMLEAGDVHPEDEGEFRRMYDQLFADAERCECTVRLRNRKTDQFIWYHLIYTRLHDAMYTTRQAMGFAANVDLQKRTQANYEHEQRLRHEMVRDSEIYFQVNLSTGMVEEYNSKYGNAGSISCPSPTSQAFRDELLRYVLPRDREAVASTFFIQGLLARWQRGETSASLDYRRLLPQGRVCWLRGTATIVKRPNNGQLIAFIYFRSIDRAKKDQLALDSILGQEVESTCIVNLSSGQAHLLKINDSLASLEEGQDFSYDLVAQQVKASVLEEDEEACRPFLSFQGLLQALEEAGVLVCTYRTRSRDGSVRRKSSRAFYLDETREDIVISRRDVTNLYDAELRAEGLRKSEEMLRLVVEHSARAIYRYDLSSRLALSMAPKASRALGLPDRVEPMPEGLFELGLVIAEDQERVRSIFAAARSGQPMGRLRFRVRGEDEVQRWLDVKYTLLKENGSPAAAVISCLDVSELHERELAYARYLQTTDAAQGDDVSYFETDITADLIEQQGGFILDLGLDMQGRSHAQAVERLVNGFVLEAYRERSRAFFARDHLLTLYTDGKRELSEEWQVLMPNGSTRWLQATVQLVADPYTGHIKAFTLLTDVTEEKRLSLEMRQRAETDGMTGLYNKTTTETLVRQRLAQGDEAPCALLIADLDNLKRVNDSLGHAQGDQALRLFSSLLRSQFRQGDIVGRVGGDEFAVFIDGAAEARLNVTLAQLMHSLSGLRLDGGQGLSLGGSIGVALGRTGRDSYEELFQKADKALYQVKRNGKGDFAFYTAEMERPDYLFRRHSGKDAAKEEASL